MKKKWLFLYVMMSVCLCFPSFLRNAVAENEVEWVPGIHVKDLLERASQADSTNYALAYYLGRVYLQEGNQDKAIAAWDRYLTTAPEDTKSTAVRERLTVLKQNQTSDWAKKVAQQTQSVSPSDIPADSIAVLNFIHDGSSEGNLLSKGLAAMIITDLAKVPSLKVVEREKIQALMNEIQLGLTGVVEENTAVKTGKLLLARNVVRGTIAEPETNHLDIGSTVTETIEAVNIGTASAKGPKTKLFDLEKQIVFGILESIGVKTEDLNPNVKSALEAYYTTRFDALLDYSRGLDFLDKRQFVEAKGAFEKAVALDPGFDMAREAMVSTPTDKSIIQHMDNIDLLQVEEVSDSVESLETSDATGLSGLTDISVGDTESLVNVAQEKIQIETQVKTLGSETGINVRW